MCFFPEHSSFSSRPLVLADPRIPSNRDSRSDDPTAPALGYYDKEDPAAGAHKAGKSAEEPYEDPKDGCWEQQAWIFGIPGFTPPPALRKYGLCVSTEGGA